MLDLQIFTDFIISQTLDKVNIKINLYKNKSDSKIQLLFLLTFYGLSAIMFIYRDLNTEGEVLVADKNDFDSFWDIEKLIPTKKMNKLSSFSTKEKTVTHSISGTENDSDVNERRLTLTGKTSDNLKPEKVYYPKGKLIKKVTVTHLPDKFDFHANFKKAAELYFDFVGTECPYAPFYSFMPQYTQLSQPQKNYYFYWRTMLRRGRFIRTDYSYFYLYVYEILNLPDRIPAEEGLGLLVAVWKNYRKILPNVDVNMALWVQDYCLVYNLPLPMDKIGDFIFDIMSVTRFKEFYFSSYDNFGTDGIGALIAYLSDYDWRKGKYAGGESKDIYIKHLMGAMGLFMDNLLKSEAFDINRDSISVRSDNAFRMALTTCDVKYNVSVEYLHISEEPWVRSVVTSALKYTENKLRALMGVKSRLAVKDLDSRYSRIIDGYFDEIFERVNRERRMANRPEYEKLYEAHSEELSLDGADEIEKASWQTTARLVEDEEIYEDEEQSSKENNATEPESNASYGLSTDEIAFIAFAFEENFEKMKEISARLGTFQDAIADRINEVFSDNFGDVILEDNGDGYVIISDYREDIENWLTKTVK